MSNCTFPLVLSEDYKGGFCTRQVGARMSLAGRVRLGQARWVGANLYCGRVSGTCLNYQKTSILRINCSIANAGNLRARLVVKVRDTGHTGTPTGVRARACAQDTLVRLHRIL